MASIDHLPEARASRDDWYARGYEAALAELGQSPPFPSPVPVPDPQVFETFGELLTRLRVRLQVSRHWLAREVECDPSYLARLEHSQRDPPCRRLVDALAHALFLNEFEYHQFVVVAGYAPVREWTAELEACYRAGDGSGV